MAAVIIACANACRSEAAAEATVGAGDVTADAPGMIDEVEADVTADPVSEVIAVAGSFTPEIMDGPRVLRGGTLKVPLLLTGSEVTTPLHSTEMVPRGGRLAHPVLLTDLEIIDGRRFIQLQKWLPPCVSSSRAYHRTSRHWHAPAFSKRCADV